MKEVWKFVSPPNIISGMSPTAVDSSFDNNNNEDENFQSCIDDL